jgi:multidrug efflux pump subunit AcrA (membrane-fusion protein)
VELTGPGGQRIRGRVRTVAPAVDPETRTGFLYADLPEPGNLRAGMFAQGELLLGAATATVLPREAVIYRDGFPYVFVAGAPGDGGLFNVQQRRITVGGQRGEVIEVQAGLEAGEKVIVRGAGFLSDGDLVREVKGDPALAGRKGP